MPFLLRTPDHFVMIENKPRQGIFSQLYTKDGFLKSTQIHAFATDNYTATLDTNGFIHLVTESSKNQILYIHFEKGIPSKKIVLEDPHHYYMFRHLHLQSLDGRLYLIYSVKHPTGNGRSLMYQPLDPSQLNISVLLQSIPDNSIIKMLPTPSKLYIVYTDFTTHYELKLATLSSSGIEHSMIYSSTLPITDFNMCLVHHTLHLTYIKDAYGKQQIAYINTHTFSESLLDMRGQSIAPSIFNYLGHLWIAYPYGSKLFMLLSTDGGEHFSIPVTSSSEGHFMPYYYVGPPSFELNTTLLYTSTTQTLRLGVLSAIDLKGIHPDLKPSSELELLLEGMRLSHHNAYIPSKPATQPPPIHIPLELTPTRPPSPHTNSSPTDMSFEHLGTSPIEPTPTRPPSRDLKSATKAFMDGLTLFDASPKG